ncbi:MAG: hypothetical protein ACJA2S_002194 [Cyclobacteriaceae bacterium]|jgi:hypothetical protein
MTLFIWRFRIIKNVNNYPTIVIKHNNYRGLIQLIE